MKRDRAVTPASPLSADTAGDSRRRLDRPSLDRPSLDRPSLGRPRRGAVLVMIAIMISALGAIVGLVVDLGLAHNERRKEQEAADAASVAAAAELARGQTAAVATAQASAVARGFGFVDGQNNVTVAVGTPTTGPNANDARFVQVTISKAMTNLFARLSGIRATRSSATASAGLVPGARRCLMALDESQSEAFAVTGTARLSVADCGVMVNSSHANAMRIGTPSNVSVFGGVSVTGGSTSSGNFAFNASAPPEPDPLGHLENPSGLAGSCTYSDLVVTTRTTLLPGTYCASTSNYALDIRLTNGGGSSDGDDEECGNNGNGVGSGSCNSNGNGGGSGNSAGGNNGVTLSPGRYVFRGGVRFAGQFTTVNGSGVTLIVTSRPNGNFVPLLFEDNVTLDLSAPTTSVGGAIPGVLVFVDRTVTTAATHVIGDAANASLDGALYFPRHTVELRDSGAARRIGITGGIVARRVSISGNVRVSVTRQTDASAALRRVALAN